jgi:hypothetical protein
MSTQSDARIADGAQGNGASGASSSAPADVRKFAYERVAQWTTTKELISPKTRAKLLVLVRELPLSLTVDGFEATFAQLASKRGDAAAVAVCEVFGNRLELSAGSRTGLDVLDKVIQLQEDQNARAWTTARRDLLRLADELKYFADALLPASSVATPSNPAPSPGTGESS